MKVMIITKRKAMIEYTCASVIDALDLYIKEKLGFNDGFAASEDLWESFKKLFEDSSTEEADYIYLINWLCKKKTRKIIKVLSDYTEYYPATEAPSGAVMPDDSGVVDPAPEV